MRIIKKMMVTFIAFIIVVFMFMVVEVSTFYHSGITHTSFARTFILLFLRPMDIDNPVASVTLQKDKVRYQVCVEHKYSGWYQIWLIGKTCHVKKCDEETKYPIAIKFDYYNHKNIPTSKIAEFLLLGNYLNWRFEDRCFGYYVDCRNERKRNKIMDIEIVEVNKLLKMLPEAFLEIRYASVK